ETVLVANPVSPTVVGGGRDAVLREEGKSFFGRAHRRRYNLKATLFDFFAIMGDVLQSKRHCGACLNLASGFDSPRSEVIVVAPEVVDNLPVGQNLDDAVSQT